MTAWAEETAVAAADVPARHNLPVAGRTVVRWIQRGVRHPAGGRVYLAGYLAGARWVTSDEAVGRFLAALNAAAPPPRRSPAGRRADHKRAEKEAEALGL